MIMIYTEITPPDNLKNYVYYFWKIEESSLINTKKDFQVLADGCPGLTFQPRHSGVLECKEFDLLPELFICGQTTLSARLELKGNFAAFGVCFYPDALQTVFGLDAYELKNSCINVLEMVSIQERNDLKQLWDTKNKESQIDIISRFLWSQIEKNNVSKDYIIDYCLKEFRNKQSKISIKELCQLLQISERTLERKFKRYVGLSPKFYSRICQFQTSLFQLKINHEIEAIDIAFENEYSDQSHFIRSFKSFTGLTPNQFKKQWERYGDLLVSYQNNVV